MLTIKPIKQPKMQSRLRSGNQEGSQGLAVVLARRKTGSAQKTSGGKGQRSGYVVKGEEDNR